MELNINRVFKKLNDYHPEQVINNAQVQFRNCELLSFAFAPFFPETLYVADSFFELQKLPEEGGFSIICNFPKKEMVNESASVQLSDKNNYLFLEIKEDPAVLYSRIKKSISDYYAMIQLSEELFQAVNNGENLERLVDLVQSYIKNSVYVFDTGFQLLAMKEGVNCYPPQLEEIGGKLYLAADGMQHVNFMHNHERLKEERKPHLVQNANFGPDRLTCMINHDRDIGHFVFVEDNLPFDEYTYDYIALFQRALQLHFEKDPFSQNAKGFHYEYFLKDLLAQKYAGHTDKNSRVKYLDKSFSGNLFCLVIETARTPEGVRIESVRQQIESILPSTSTVVYESQIVGVVSDYSGYRMEQDLLCRLRSICEKNNLYCGMSNAFFQVLDLYRYYKQALRAIEAGAGQKGGSGLFVYEDFQMEHLKNIFSSIEDIEVFCCPQMKVLFAYDKENETELAKTLYYFLLFGNTKDAAEKLFVHRNTILYRIRLINDLIGNDYQEFAIRRYLMLSYEMMNDTPFI